MIYDYFDVFFYFVQAFFPGFDPEVYNADGTMRTVHQMPSAETAWEEAQKARYIRSKDLQDRDKELSVTEIFAKDSNWVNIMSWYLELTVMDILWIATCVVNARATIPL